MPAGRGYSLPTRATSAERGARETPAYISDFSASIEGLIKASTRRTIYMPARHINAAQPAHFDRLRTRNLITPLTYEVDLDLSGFLTLARDDIHIC